MSKQQFRPSCHLGLVLVLAACSAGDGKSTLTERRVKATIQDCLDDRSGTDAVKSVGPILAKSPSETEVHLLLPVMDMESMKILDMKMLATFVIDQSGKYYLSKFYPERDYHGISTGAAQTIRDCQSKLPLAAK